MFKINIFMINQLTLIIINLIYLEKLVIKTRLKFYDIFINCLQLCIMFKGRPKKYSPSRTAVFNKYLGAHILLINDN